MKFIDQHTVSSMGLEMNTVKLLNIQGAIRQVMYILTVGRIHQAQQHLFGQFGENGHFNG